MQEKWYLCDICFFAILWRRIPANIVVFFESLGLYIRLFVINASSLSFVISSYTFAKCFSTARCYRVWERNSKTMSRVFSWKAQKASEMEMLCTANRSDATVWPAHVTVIRSPTDQHNYGVKEMATWHFDALIAMQTANNGSVNGTVNRLSPWIPHDIFDIFSWISLT